MLVLWPCGSWATECWDVQELTAKKERNRSVPPCLNVYTLYISHENKQSVGLDSRSSPSMYHPSFHHELPL